MKTLLHLEKNLQPLGKEMCLPVDASQEEVQTALNLGAVYETVDVESIYSLSGWTSSPMTSWEPADEKGRKKTKNELTWNQQAEVN